jgi:nucleoside-diphosphate-sugar epimerase
VLGASGFVGQWVAQRIATDWKEGRLWCAGRDPAAVDTALASHGVQATACRVDVLSRPDLEHLLREVRPHVVFNLVGYGVDPTERDEALARAVNVELVRVLLALVGEHADPAWPGAQLVHTGSALEYGDVAGELSEDREGRPTSSYGATKLAGTKLIVQAHHEGRALRATVARLFTVFGPGEHRGRLLPTLLEASRTSDRIALTSGSQLRDFTYVEDVALGLVRLSTVGAEGPALINLGTGRLSSVREFILAAAEELGLSPTRLGFGDVPQRPEEIPHARVTTERLRNSLGWVPETSIREGVRATVAWLRARDGKDRRP